MSRRSAPPWLSPLITVVVVLALAAAWKWSPLAGYLSVERWTGVEVDPTDAKTIAVVMGVYVAGGLLIVPVSAMFAVTFVVLPEWALAYALAGALLNASVTYVVGRLLGEQWLGRLLGRRAEGLSRRLRRRGWTTVFTVRFVPLGPFTVINLVTGACRVRFVDYLVGTTLGLLPGLVALHFITRGVLGASTATDWAGAVVAVAALVGATAWARRRTRNRRKSNARGSESRVDDSSAPSLS